MFGVGLQELLIIGLLFLVIFGPGKAVGMARDFGRFVSGAQDTVEEFKEGLFLREGREVRRSVEEFKDEAQRSGEGLKSEVASGEGRDASSSDTPPNESEARELKKGKELAREEEASPF